MAETKQKKVKVAQMGATKSDLSTYAGIAKQLIVVTDDGYRLVVMDGSIQGGKFKTASLDELEQAKRALQEQIDAIKGDGEGEEGSLKDKLDTSVYEADKPKFARRDEANTFAQAATFSSTVTVTTSPTEGTHVTNKTYVDTEVGKKLGKNENATSATKLQTARNITLTGNATGTVSFDGSGDASINVTVTQAQNSTKATQDSEGNSIKDTYATKTELGDKLDSEVASSTYATKSELSNKANTSVVITKTGDRGTLSGFNTGVKSGAAATIDKNSPDDGEITSGTSISVSNGASGESWCKVRRITTSIRSISLGSNWKWQGGETPEIKFPCILTCYWCNGGGFAFLTVGVK